jgi:hypothetical protein
MNRAPRSRVSDEPISTSLLSTRRDRLEQSAGFTILRGDCDVKANCMRMFGLSGGAFRIMHILISDDGARRDLTIPIRA